MNTKYIYYQFDLFDALSIRIKCFSLEEAINIFKITFGESLLKKVKSIYNIDYHG